MRRAAEVGRSLSQTAGNLKDLAAAARSIPLLGRQVRCPLCRWSFRHLTRGGASMRRKPNGYCPRCNSKPRHRWLWLNLADVVPEPGWPSLRLLHVAPAHSTARVFSKRRFGAYVPIDIAPSARSVARTDLCRPGLRDRSFDLVVCIHVLEHLDDDRAAMSAMRDLVRPGGLVAVGVPVRDEFETLEDPSISDPADRAQHFGEPDHRRWYGRDIVGRLEDAGFDVDVRLTSDAPESVRRRHGLTTGEGLFFCRRSTDPAARSDGPAGCR